MNMANSGGEIGHPCLTPLCKANGFDIIPLYYIIPYNNIIIDREHVTEVQSVDLTPLIENT